MTTRLASTLAAFDGLQDRHEALRGAVREYLEAREGYEAELLVFEHTDVEPFEQYEEGKLRFLGILRRFRDADDRLRGLL